MRKYWLITTVGVLMLLAAACQSAPPPGVQVAPAAVAQQPPTEMQEAPLREEGQSPAIEPTAQVEPGPATPVAVRQGLTATDPATVNLSNGSPKLVEFFAFW